VKLSLIAAVARDGVIGRDNAIPWQLPEDARRFREVTLGHPVVMGRRTWDSLPQRFRPLPGRRNVVVTRNGAWRADGAERAGSLEDALTLLEGEPQVFVVGGAELYAQALPRADELVVTEIDAEVEGDVYFPEWDRALFREESREEHVSGDGVRFAYVTYRRDRAEA
jgi:dihydrofolate reductase